MIFKKHDYEAEITELKLKLQAAEAEKIKMQQRINLLESSIKLAESTDAVYKQQQILDNFKQELANLPPLEDNIKLTERYNYLFVLIDSLVIPMLVEYGFKELADKIGVISKRLRKDAIELMANRIKIAGDDIEKHADLFKRFISCDEEIKQLFKDADMAPQNIRYCNLFIKNVKETYGDALGRLSPVDKESTKRWLEMIISIGTQAISLANSCDLPKNFASGIMRELLDLKPHNHHMFAHYDYERSTSDSNSTYELLLDLSKQYGIDLSKMKVFALDDFNVCAPHYNPTHNIQSGKER
ncbi:MAG: hypothetical protein R8M71_00060 [Alphaproteobacteria bacterium]|nr:hypothetical protein [Alphaproteobacteria bacterium]